MKRTSRLGAHVSVAGGVSKAPGNGVKSGCDIVQIFTRYPTRWVTPPIASKEVDAFHAAREKTGVHAVAAHASYLINLASGDDSLYEKSVSALEDELSRARQLKIEYVVVHPGSSGSQTEREGIARVGRAVGEVLKAFRDVTLCLETTAGQGSSLGYRLDQLRHIIDEARSPENVCICLDSCHLFAAGYDIVSPKGFKSFTRELDSLDLTERVKVIHVNDSKGELGSRVDRHGHIGEGQIGIQGFANLLNHPPFRGLPFILETPKRDDPAKSDRENISRLRALLKRR